MSNFSTQFKEALSTPIHGNGQLLFCIPRLSIIILSFFVLSLYGCTKSQEINRKFTPAALPTPQPADLPVVTTEPSTPLPPYTMWIDPRLPSSIFDMVEDQDLFEITLQSEEAQLRILPTNVDILDYWVYTVVVPYSSLIENYKTEDLLNIWRFGFPDDTSLYLSKDTKQALSILWGEPNQENIKIVNPELLIEEIWANPTSIAIIPFEELKPRYKIITLDNIHPLANDFSPANYPLSLPLSLKTDSIDQFPISSFGLSNYSRNKLTSIALTGVTAMVRDTAAIMEEKGILYPSADIRPILENVDITHISNEVPFAEDCPVPDSNQPSLFFCSNDEYIKLLEAVGTDIVELSGDHFGDWGPEAMLHSLDIYDQHGLLTYGGGETLQDGLDPVFIDHNNNKIVFIGCNGKVHYNYATATETNPGASRCNFDWMLPKINRLSNEGYLVIATMQHEEVDSFYPIAIQQYDFRRLADAGATIVSGSQAHHPQAIEFYNSSFIHYGLGNLFFDQWYLATRNPEVHENKDKAFIDIHYFYDGSYINSRLIPIQFVDNAKPRPMSSDETADFLTKIYGASVWNIPTD